MNKITGYPKESPTATATPTTALCVEMEFTLTFQAHSRLFVVFINYQNVTSNMVSIVIYYLVVASNVRIKSI